MGVLGKLTEGGVHLLQGEVGVAVWVVVLQEVVERAGGGEPGETLLSDDLRRHTAGSGVRGRHPGVRSQGSGTHTHTHQGQGSGTHTHRSGVRRSRKRKRRDGARKRRKRRQDRSTCVSIYTKNHCRRRKRSGPPAAGGRGRGGGGAVIPVQLGEAGGGWRGLAAAGSASKLKVMFNIQYSGSRLQGFFC